MIGDTKSVTVFFIENKIKILRFENCIQYAI